jgi:hypothetical protein
MQGRTDTFNILVGKLRGKALLGRRREDNIKIDLEDVKT